MELALGEVYESIGENRISRIAVNDDKSSWDGLAVKACITEMFGSFIRL